MGQREDVDIRLAELMASRLCHELVGVAGAVANGVELLGELAPGETADDAMGLVGKSAGQIVARLKFFRLAYGYAGRSSDDVPELRSVSHALVEGGNTQLTWPLPPMVPDLVEGSGKLILNMVLMGHESLIRGGVVKVDVDDDRIAVVANGGDAALPQEVVAALTTDVAVADLTPRSVQGAWARAMAAQAGYSLDYTAEPGCVSLIATRGG